jgi:hypothetical protein
VSANVVISMDSPFAPPPSESAETTSGDVSLPTTDQSATNSLSG